jgi:acetoacetyl-CoA synthetase
VESVRYNGKVLSQREKLTTVVDGLQKARKKRDISSKFEVVVSDYLGEGYKGGVESLAEGWKTWDALLEVGAAEKGESDEIEFWQGGFNHPLWVLFSSGTTGKVSSFFRTLPGRSS